MAVTEEQLHAAGQLIAAAATLREAAAQWRTRHPSVRAMLLDAADMRDETPVIAQGARRVYLVAGNGHCWRVTQQAGEASALVLTQD